MTDALGSGDKRDHIAKAVKIKMLTWSSLRILSTYTTKTTKAAMKFEEKR